MTRDRASNKTQRDKIGAAAVRSVPLEEWPAADRLAWNKACFPQERLKRGGSASHLSAVTRDDLVQRYGYFLDFVHRTEGLDLNAEAASCVTAGRVKAFVTELQDRVSSVTVAGTIYKVRRMTQLLSPGRDLVWLTDLEKDLALVMQPKSKFDRLVYGEVLVEAGLTLMQEADADTKNTELSRARQFRDGFMIALLALCPIRLKNFAALEIDRTFRKVNDSWWIVLSAAETKERRADERPVPKLLTKWIDLYVAIHRPVLGRRDDKSAHLWLSSIDGRALSYSAIERTISKTTLATIGVDVSPHLFRAAAATTAAIHAGHMPHLASALLHHTDPAVTENHYNRASSLQAGQIYAAIVREHRDR